MPSKKFIVFLSLFGVIIAAIAAIAFLPKTYQIGDQSPQTSVFWNDHEAFLFLTTNSVGRCNIIVQEKLAATRYFYFSFLLANCSRYYEQKTTAYHLLPSGQLDRFALPAHTTIYGAWSLANGNLTLTPHFTARVAQSGFRWNGAGFEPVHGSPKPEADLKESSKLAPDDQNDTEDDDAPLEKSSREAFKSAGWHYKILYGYEARNSPVSLPIALDKNRFNLNLESFPANSAASMNFDQLHVGTRTIALSGPALASPSQILWSQSGWRSVTKSEYNRLLTETGIRHQTPSFFSVWLLLILFFAFWKFWSWANLLLIFFGVKRKVLSGMATAFSFPPAAPAQFPSMNVAELDRYTREFESMGFVRVLDFSLVSDGKNYPPSFCRLMANTRLHCFGEINQFFPAGKPAMPLKCSILSTLQDGWSLSVADRKPQAASSLMRRRRALGVCMPEATTSELLQSFTKMREQVCQDLGISPMTDDTLEAYIARTQRVLVDLRQAVKQKSFFTGIPNYYYRRLSLLNTKKEYVWLGDYPKEAEKRNQGLAPQPATR